MNILARLERAALSIPDSLPFKQKIQEVADTLQTCAVTIVAGDTGSGKSTQLPKICLALGFEGIGHTQPRRIAVHSLANRLQEEIRPPFSERLGYQTRFEKKIPPHCLYKLMTDGILLSELAPDPQLKRYDVLIIDEAHERSLNIDFLLGCLKKLLPKRPDLRLIITSASLEEKKFSTYFDGAPIITIPGLQFPIQTRYQPLPLEREEGPQELSACNAGILKAFQTLDQQAPGDLLVFLPGEAEIDSALEAAGPYLEQTFSEGLVLHARLSSEKQRAIFAPGRKRRIIFSTNVAETSLTLPRIAHVIDAGTARISRYSTRTKQQLLQIEPISQAAANQRKGRCGRIGPGICIRLYSRADYESRSPYNDPEIRRTLLASVLLRMALLDLGPPSQFPFLDSPQTKRINEALGTLWQLNACTLSPTGKSIETLTPVGARMARLPLDPRLARALVAAQDCGLGKEMAIVLGALCADDPFERPLAEREQARQAHRIFQHPKSEFLVYLKLWIQIQTWKTHHTHREFKTLCRKHFINLVRVYHWQRVVQDFLKVCDLPATTPLQSPSELSYDAFHSALITGLMGQIALYSPDLDLYKSASGGGFSIHPSSSLKKSRSPWIVVGQLVETERRWGKVIAHLSPELIESTLAPSIQWRYAEPYWDPDREGVYAEGCGNIFGLPLIQKRPVYYGRINATHAREIFIHQAIIANSGQKSYPFLQANADFQKHLQNLERKRRFSGLCLTSDQQREWYHTNIPAHLISGGAFESWLRKNPAPAASLEFRQNPIFLNRLKEAVSQISPNYPDFWTLPPHQFRIKYPFNPENSIDSIVIQVPNRVMEPWMALSLGWHLPAYRAELAVALIKTLPKSLRVRCQPTEVLVQAFLCACEEVPRILKRSTIEEALGQFLFRTLGIKIPPLSWRWDQIPEYLKVKLCILAPEAQSSNPEPIFWKTWLEQNAIQIPHPQIRVLPDQDGSSKATLAPNIPKCPLIGSTVQQGWVFGNLKTCVPPKGEGPQYPSLNLEHQRVHLYFSGGVQQQHESLRQAIAGMLSESALGSARKVWGKSSANLRLSLLQMTGIEDPEHMVHEITMDLVIESLRAHQTYGIVWNLEAYQTLKEDVLLRFKERYAHYLDRLEAAYPCYEQFKSLFLKTRARPLYAKGRMATYQWLKGRLLPLRRTEQRFYPERLLHLPRYLDALTLRLEEYPRKMDREREFSEFITQFRLRLGDLRKRIHIQYDIFERETAVQSLRAIDWEIEEWHVSYFAQKLGTLGTVSKERLTKKLETICQNFANL